MEKKKNIYEQPDSTVTRVELESPICSGSINAEAQSPEAIDTQAQEVNTAFGEQNNFGSSSTWTEN